jgi:hypothetical protein
MLLIVKYSRFAINWGGIIQLADYPVTLFRKLGAWNNRKTRNDAPKLTLCYMQKGQSKNQTGSIISKFQSFLKMVYNTRDRWVLGILKNTNISMYRKLDLLPSSGEGIGDACSLGSVRKSQLQSLLNNLNRPVIELDLSNGPNRAGVSHHSPDDGNRSSFRNLCVVFFRILDDGQSKGTQ